MMTIVSQMYYGKKCLNSNYDYQCALEALAREHGLHKVPISSDVAVDENSDFNGPDFVPYKMNSYYFSYKDIINSLYEKDGNLYWRADCYGEKIEKEDVDYISEFYFDRVKDEFKKYFKKPNKPEKDENQQQGLQQSKEDIMMTTETIKQMYYGELKIITTNNPQRGMERLAKSAGLKKVPIRSDIEVTENSDLNSSDFVPFVYSEDGELYKDIIENLYEKDNTLWYDIPDGWNEKVTKGDIDYISEFYFDQVKDEFKKYFKKPSTSQQEDPQQSDDCEQQFNKSAKNKKQPISLKQNLIRYIDAGFPILLINSHEESKIDAIIKEVAGERDIVEWNGANGLVNFDTKVSYELMDSSLAVSLKFFLKLEDIQQKIIVLKDAHLFFEDPEVVAVLKDMSEKIGKGEIGSSIIIESPVRTIPKELEPYTTILEMDYLETDEISKIIEDFIKANEADPISPELLEEMAAAFKGLAQSEIEKILALAYAENGKLSREDLELIFEQKQQIVMRSGIMEMIPLKESLEDIGGLENLKQWLRKKAKVLKNIERTQEFGADIPKGVLIAGVPGCGKSLNAKASAQLLGVPLLRLDMGSLMGKYVGESEANMRKATALAEAIAPCVLWVDELEKAFAGIGGTGGATDITTRLFGNFLTWMQEKESSVFVVATANDITKLPPELLRKGRFDEIFYVGLPNEKERKKIFEIHIAKRRKADLAGINLDTLVSRTKGYSGADIEGVVKESIENAYADGKDKLTTEDILEAVKNTHSLSEIMKEPLKRMTEEYENRKFKNASV